MLRNKDSHGQRVVVPIHPGKDLKQGTLMGMIQDIGINTRKLSLSYWENKLGIILFRTYAKILPNPLNSVSPVSNKVSHFITFA